MLGCRTLRLESQSSAGLRMQPYPRAPDLVWPGHLHGTGCLSARAMDTGFPTVAWLLRLGLGCGWVWVSAAPRHSWLGCWGVYVLWACSACTPPLLAGVCGVGVCVWVLVSAAPRHSWLGCWGVCVLVCALRLYPATPGWGVRCGCVCLGSGFGCAPPLLAGVCGVGACAWARVSAAPRHSWLGWWGVCVLVCVLPLYPATPGWGVRRGCVCLGSGFGCAPPFLAGVVGCGCGCLGSGFGCAPPLLAGVLGCVCAVVRAPLVPRHSWLGCAAWLCVFGLGFRLRPAIPGWAVGVCVFVCVLPLFPATPGWGVRCGCVCLGSGFGCAPPFLAGVLGCVCAGVRAPLVPRHSWLGCAAWVCVFGLGFRLRPAIPGWGVGVCVLVCVLPLFPATPGWGVRCGCVCFGSGSGCAPPLLAGVLGCVCAGVRAPLVPRHSWLGCAVWVCVFGVGFRLRPAAPGWGVGVCVLVCVLPLYPATPGWGVRCGCVCLGSGFGCAPPLLAGVLGCVCAGVGAPLVPRHSWLGCALWVCVFGCGFRLRPATPGWGVGVCVLVCALPLYPATPGWGVRHVCVLGLRFRLRPATPGWGVGVCVCWCARSACTPPLLAGVCGVGVCVWARVSAAPRHSWLGCWGVCVLVCALRLYPATPGWGVRCGFVCLGSGFGCAPPPLAGVLGCACLCACSPCTPPLLAGVCGVGVCVWVRVSAAPCHSWLGWWGVCALLVPRHSWLGCAVWVCVLALGFRLRPATPGWGVGVCVCWCARSACTPPLLAGVCGVGVCVWGRVSAAPRRSWLGCWGVRACVRAPLVPRHSWLGCAVWVCVFGFGFRLRPATPGWGGGVCVLSFFARRHILSPVKTVQSNLHFKTTLQQKPVGRVTRRMPLAPLGQCKLECSAPQDPVGRPPAHMGDICNISKELNDLKHGAEGRRTSENRSHDRHVCASRFTGCIWMCTRN